MSLGLSTKTSKQARREKKRSRREAGLVDGVAAELIDAYLVEHYICDGCGRFQLAMCGYFIEETGEVVLAPCHEWDSEAKAWAISGCQSETARTATSWPRLIPSA